MLKMTDPSYKPRIDMPRCPIDNRYYSFNASGPMNEFAAACKQRGL
jgi:hypothetical protein